MACLFCGGQALEPLYEGIRDHYGVDVETHRFLRCADCGSATLDPLPSPSRLAALYSADYTFKPAPAHSALRRLLQAIEWKCFYEPGYRRRLAILRRLTGLHGGRVLEVGCGSGLFLRFLEKAGYDVEGVETSPADVAYARERLGLTVYEGALEALPFERGGYDAVVMVYVLEHIPAEKEDLFISNLIAPLREHGTLIIGTPSLQSQAYASRLSKEGHINCKDQNDLKQLMRGYFHNVYTFSMNDEVVHTGYHAMSHYNFVLCCGKKRHRGSP